MNIFKNIFRKKNMDEAKQNAVDEVNRNYVCIPFDPIHSMNDLREGDWNMDKVQESFAMGLLRYAKESEIQEAKTIGRIKA